MAYEEKRIGIVTRLSSFKEADAMINAIGEEGFFSFAARGIKKPKSKNSSAVQPLCLSEFSLFYTDSNKASLKQASPIALLYRDDDFASSSVAQLMLEIVNKLVGEEEAKEVYPFFKKGLEEIKKGKDALTIGLIFLSNVLRLIGYGLNVDECVSCGKKKDIVSLSLEEGGFLCSSCAEEKNSPAIPSTKLKIYRYLFKAGIEEIGRLTFPKNEALYFYETLSRHLENLTGVRLGSIDLIKIA